MNSEFLKADYQSAAGLWPFLGFTHWHNKRRKLEGKCISPASRQRAGARRSRRNCRSQDRGPRLQPEVDESFVGWKCADLWNWQPIWVEAANRPGNGRRRV